MSLLRLCLLAYCFLHLLFQTGLSWWRCRFSRRLIFFRPLGNHFTRERLLLHRLLCCFTRKRLLLYWLFYCFYRFLVVSRISQARLARLPSYILHALDHAGVCLSMQLLLLYSLVMTLEDKL